MRRLFATLFSGLALMFMATAVAAADDGPITIGGPITGPVIIEPIDTLCARALEPESPLPGELPVLEDPVSASTDALGCDPRAQEEATSFTLMADARTVLASVKSEAAFTTDANGTVQVRINASAVGKNGAQARGAAARYEVTVTIPAVPPAQPRVVTRTVDVSVSTLQNDGSIGGTNLTTFAAGDIPVGATASVRLVSGTVTVVIGNVGVVATADQENLPPMTK
jgi:hypothetical protein